MNRTYLFLAAALTALPLAAFAQGTGSDSKTAAHPMATTESKPAATTDVTRTGTTVKSDAPTTKNQPAVKTMHANPAHTGASTGAQVKQPEAPKS